MLSVVIVLAFRCYSRKLVRFEQHVCADTLRSIAVLVAAAIATIFASIDGAIADSLAAVAVSIIILISLVPLIEGLILTALQIHQHHRNPVSG